MSEERTTPKIVLWIAKWNDWMFWIGLAAIMILAILTSEYGGIILRCLLGLSIVGTIGVGVSWLSEIEQ